MFYYHNFKSFKCKKYLSNADGQLMKKGVWDKKFPEECCNKIKEC